MNDLELIDAYVREGSQPAFAELARRYVNVVYSAALRHVRNPHDAEDVTQVVFLLLARKAKRLGGGVIVAAWLLRATHFACRSHIRGETRRKRHENKAAIMSPANQPVAKQETWSPDWERVAPLLDEAMESLNTPARNAVVLRFFEKKSFKEVADRLAIGEPAARQRVSRSIEQLRAFFTRRGVVLAAGAIETLVAAHAVGPAPKALAGAAAKAGAGGAAVAARHAAILKGAAIGMLPLSLKLGAVAVFVMFIGAGSGTYWAYHNRPDNTVTRSLEGYSTSSEAMSPLRGRVVDDAGRPVPGAQVLLARASAAASVYGPPGNNVLSVLTGADGGFEFPPKPDATAVVARADQGFAQLKVADLRGAGQLKLVPWGRIEGTLRLGAKPLANQKIGLSRTGGTPNDWTAWRVMHETSTLSDSDGHFAFPRVIPIPSNSGSELILHWSPPGSAGTARAETVTVAPRQTLRVDLGGTGRAVIGRLNIPAGVPSMAGLMYAQPSDARLPSGTPSGGAPSTRMQTIPIVVQADGTFRAEDVPAGAYWAIFTSSQPLKGMPLSESLADGSAPVVMPDTTGLESKPLDIGLVQVRKNDLLWPGQAAPDFSASGASGKPVRLQDYRGKYVLLHIRMPGQDDEQWVRTAGLKAVYDQFGDDPRFALFDVRVDTSMPGPRARPQAVPWTTATAAAPATSGAITTGKDPSVPAIYFSSPTRLYVIGPDGKCVARSLNARAALPVLARALGKPAANAKVKATIERHVPASPSNLAEDQDVARGAKITVVDGEVDDASGGPGVLTDGRLAAGDDQPAASFFFEHGSLEGRLRMDLDQATTIRQIASYSRHKGHRAPQVYKVYGSDGSAANFNRVPKIGTDPTTCGWSKIADVDTRPSGGPDGGQYGVTLASASGSIGTYRHLLFVTFVTETDDDFGQTFFNEIAVIRAEGRP